MELKEGGRKSSHIRYITNNATYMRQIKRKQQEKNVKLTLCVKKAKYSMSQANRLQIKMLFL